LHQALGRDMKDPERAQPDELDELLTGLFDPGLSEPQGQRLHVLLASNPSARQRYIAYVTLNAMLQYELQWQNTALLEELRTPFTAASHKLPVPMISSGRTREHPDAMPSAREQTRRRAARRKLALRVAALLALVLSAILAITSRQHAVNTERREPALATLGATNRARWEGEAPGVAGDGRLAAAKSYVLAAGCAEVDFAGGARIVVEGPAVFTVNSGSAMSLSSGPVDVTALGGGFVVTTPTASITDLGTEFGVAAKSDGTTDVEVFQGSVQAAPVSAQAKPGKVLTVLQAASISKAAVTLNPDGASPQRFVRSVTTEAGNLDVVDLVAGGDGTTHRRGMSIDSLTGRSGPLPHKPFFKGDGKYHAVPTVPVVDGCFVPDGTRGPDQVDSAGDRFAFPKTSDNSPGIWAGGKVPSSWAVVPGSTVVPILTTLENVDYAQGTHGLLHIHSNAGLTLDLTAIRRLHPGTSISRFRCIAGNSFITTVKFNVNPSADLYVLVDGKQRFARRAFSPQDGAFAVEVLLQDSDRFFTLAVTDGGDTTTFDWVLLGDPVLDLKQGPSTTE
jgi:hypothetical protein